MKPAAPRSLASVLAATILLSGCVTIRGPMYQGDPAGIQASVAKAMATLDQRGQAACPVYGTQPAVNQLANARQKLLADIATINTAADKLEAEYKHLVATWKPGRNEYLHPERDYAADQIAVRLVPAVTAWQDAAVASIAVDRMPYDPRQSALHPGWGMRADLKTDLEAITGAAERVRSPRLSASLRAASQRVSNCGVGYRPQYLTFSVAPLRAYAMDMKSTAQIDRFVADIKLDSLASTSPVLADLRTEIAQVRSDRAAVEQAAALAEQRRQQAERDRLAAQARQAQIAENERRAAAAEAERQRQIAVAAAQAEQERMQEVWRKNFAAKRLPFSYLACSGREYVSSELGKSLTGIIGLAPTESVTAYKFEARFEPDMKYIEISEREGPSPTREGRFRLRFVGPEKIAFDVNYTLTSPFAGGGSKSYKGEAFIDLESGNISGSINYARDPGGPARDRWDGFCSRRK